MVVVLPSGLVCAVVEYGCDGSPYAAPSCSADGVVVLVRLLFESYVEVVVPLSASVVVATWLSAVYEVVTRLPRASSVAVGRPWLSKQVTIQVAA